MEREKDLSPSRVAIENMFLIQQIEYMKAKKILFQCIANVLVITWVIVILFWTLEQTKDLVR